MAKQLRFDLDSYSSGNVEDSSSSGLDFKKAPSRDISLKQFPTIEGGNIDLSDYTDILDENKVNVFNPNLDEDRAQAQSGMSLIGKALVQSAAEVGLGTLESGAYLLDYENYRNILKNTGDDYGNWFSDSMREAKEYINEEVAPIYQTREAQTSFAPTDATWWASNAPSMASTLSMMIPAAGAVKGVSTLGKLLGASKLINSAQKAQAAKGITGALFSRFMENTLESRETFERTFQEVNNNPEYANLSDEDKRLMAGKAARDSWLANSANLAWDIPQYMLLYRAPVSIASSGKEVKRGLSKAGEVAFQGLQEGAEEVTQAVIGETATRGALQNKSFMEALMDKETLKNFEDPHTWTAGFFGALGGAVFSSGIGKKVVQGIDKARGTYKNIAAELQKKRLGVIGDVATIKKIQDTQLVPVMLEHANNGELHKMLSDVENLLEGVENEEDKKHILETKKKIEKFEEQYNSVMDNMKVSKDIKQHYLMKLQQIEVSNNDIATRNENIEKARTEALKNSNQEQVEYTELLNELFALTRFEAVHGNHSGITKSSRERMSIETKNRKEKVEARLKELRETYKKTQNEELTQNQAYAKATFEDIASKVESQIYQKEANYLANEIANSNPEVEKEILEETEDLQAETLFREYMQLPTNTDRKSFEANLKDNNVGNKAKKKIEKFKKDRVKEESTDYERPVLNEKSTQQEVISAFSGAFAGKPYIEEDTLNKLNVNTVEELADKFVNDSVFRKNVLEKYSKAGPENPPTPDWNEQNDKKPDYVPKTPSEDPTYAITIDEVLGNWSEEQAKAFGFDIDFMVDPENLTPGTELSLEVDMDVMERTSTEEFLKSKITAKSLPILLVAYDANGGRHVVGLLRAGTNNSADAYNTLREQVFKEWNKSDKTGRWVSSFTTKVEEKLPGQLNDTLNKATRQTNRISDVAHHDGDIILGIVMPIKGPEGQFLGRKMSIPNSEKFEMQGKELVPVSDEKIDNLPEGTVYTWVKAPDSKYYPVRVYTKMLPDIATYQQEFNEAFDNWDSAPVSQTLERLRKISGRANKLQVTSDGQIAYLVKGKPEIIGKENIKQWLLEGVGQVNESEINRGDYNNQLSEAGVIATNVDVVKPFHSPSIKIGTTAIANNPRATQGTQQSSEPTTPTGQEPTDINDILNGQRHSPDETTDKEVDDNDDNPLGAAPFSVDDATDGSWNESKAIDWLQSVLPQVPRRVIKGYIKVLSNGVGVVGMFQGNLITLSNMAAPGVEYHEAYHAVFRMFLGNKDRAAILSEARTMFGRVVKEEFNTLAEMHPTLTNAELEQLYYEEKLADYFRDYMLMKDEMEPTLTNKILNFFKDLYYMVKQAITGKMNIHRLNRKIEKKDFANLDIHPEAQQRLMQREAYAVTKLKSSQEQHYTTFLANHITQYVIPEIQKRFPKLQGLSPEEVINEVGFIAPVTTSNDNVSPENKLPNMSILDIAIRSTKQGAKEKVAAGEMSEDGYNRLKYALEQIFVRYTDGSTSLGVLIKPFVRHLTQRKKLKLPIDDAKIITQAANNGFQESLMDMYAEEESGDYIEHWIRASQEVSNLERLSPKLKAYLDGVPVIDPITGERIMVEGIPSYHSGNVAYNTVIKELSGVYNYAEMISRLEKLSETKPLFKLILHDITNDNSYRDSLKMPRNTYGKGLGTDIFVQLASKAFVKYSFVAQSKDGEFRIFNSNRTNVVSQIIGEWKYTYDNSNFPPEKAKAVVDRIDKFKKILQSNKRNDYHANKKLTEKGLNELYEIINSTPFSLSKEAISEMLFPEGAKDPVGEAVIFLNNYNFRNLLNVIANGGNPFLEGAEETTLLTNIAKKYAKGLPSMYQLSIRNVEDKTVYSHINNNFMFRHLHRLQTDMSYRKSYLASSFYNNSPWLNEDESVIQSLDFSILDGYRSSNSSKGVPFSNLNAAQYESLLLSAFLNSGGKSTEGQYLFPMLSDSSSAVMMKAPKYGFEIALDKLTDAAMQEVARVKDFIDNPSEFSKYKNFSGKGDKFLMFPELNGIDLTLDDTQTAAIVRERLADRVAKEIGNYTKKLEELAILQNGKFSTEYMSKSITNAQQVIQDYVINDMLATSQMIGLFSGDPAFYKTTKGELNIEDFYKRNKQNWSPKLFLNFKNKNYNTLYVKDVEKSASSFTEKELIDTLVKANQLVTKENFSKQEAIKAAKEIAKNYFSGNISVTDAQAYITLDRYKEIMEAAERWSAQDQEAYDRIMANEANVSDIRRVFNPVKPFYYGHSVQEYTKSNGEKGTLFSPEQNKNSEFVLLPQIAFLTKDGEVEVPIDGDYSNYTRPELARLLARMQNQGEFSDTNIFSPLASVQFDSAVKDELDNTHRVNDVMASNAFTTTVNGQQVEKKVTLSNDNYGIQVETPEHHRDSKNNFGTQIRKLIIADIDTTALYNIGFIEGVTDEEGNVTGEILVELYQKAWVADIVEGYEGLEQEFQEPEKLFRLLREQAEAKEVGEDYLKALDLAEQGQFPLWHPLIIRETEAIFNSLFKNRIVKAKINGGQFYNVSSFGMTNELQVKLNPATGAVEYVEAYLPAWSEDIIKAYMNEQGVIDFEQLENDESFQKLLNAVGYRIPTEDKYSMYNIKVKGFLPPSSGGAVILPTEVTTITGLDFDIDKLFVMFYEHELNTTYSKQELLDSENVKSALRAYLQGNPFANFKQFGKEPLTAAINLLVTPNKELDDYTIEYKKALKKSLPNDVLKLEPIASSLDNTKSRNNLKIDIIRAILQSPSGTESFLNPGSFQAQKDLRNEILEWLGESDKIAPSLLSPSYKGENFKKVMAGMKLVGIFANANSNHSLTMYSNISFVNDKKANLPYMETEGGVRYFTQLNIKSDIEGNRISKTLASWLAAVVDNAKDPVAGDVNISLDTANMLTMMVRLGIPERNAIYFLNNPHIRSIVRESNLQNKPLSVLLKEFKAISPNLTLKIVQEKERDRNVVLGQLRALMDMQGAYSNLVRAGRVDTPNGAAGPTVAHNESTIRMVQDAIYDERLNGVDEFFSQESKLASQYSFYKYGIEKATDLITQAINFPYKEGLLEDIKDAFTDSFLKSYKYMTEDEINRINSQFVIYASRYFNGLAVEDLNEFISKMPQRLTNIKKTPFYNQYKPFLAHLQIVSKGKNIPFDFIKFKANQGGMSKSEIQDIKDIWDDMMNDPDERVANFAKDLAKYTYQMSGFSYHPNSFSQLIPLNFVLNLENSDGVRYIDYITDRLYDLTATSPALDYEAFQSYYIRNFYRKSELVPFLDVEESEDVKVKGDSLIVDGRLPQVRNKINNGNDLEMYVPYVKAIVEEEFKLYKLTSAQTFDGETVLEYVEVPAVGEYNYIIDYNDSYDAGKVVSNSTIPTEPGNTSPIQNAAPIGEVKTPQKTTTSQVVEEVSSTTVSPTVEVLYEENKELLAKNGIPNFEAVQQMIGKIVVVEGTSMEEAIQRFSNYIKKCKG